METTNARLEAETEAVVQIAIAFLKRIAGEIDAVCDWYSDDEVRFSVEVCPCVLRAKDYDYRYLDRGKLVSHWCGKDGRGRAIRWLIHKIVESKMDHIEALYATEIHSQKD